MTGVAKNTVAKLLVDLGAACADFQDKAVRNLTTKRVQCDEIWAFVGAKDANLPAKERGKFARGSVWTWTAIDADSMLVLSFMIGDRGAGTAHRFMKDVAARLANSVQMTTDAHKVYLTAVEAAFAGDVDYAQLVKIYGADHAGEARYSPAVCLGTEEKAVCG